jgi:hypothetical protein
MIGGGDANRIDIFVVKDSAIVADWLCSSPLSGSIQTLLPDIANSNDVNWLTLLLSRIGGC